MKDALGFEIEMGKLYGYSSRKNGIVSVKIGEAIKESASGRIILKVIKSGHALYQKDITEGPTYPTYTPSTSVNVTANSLFKLENSKVNW